MNPQQQSMIAKNEKEAKLSAVSSSNKTPCETLEYHMKTEYKIQICGCC